LDALEKGATVLTGGQRLRGEEYDKGWYFPPTIISDTNHSMKIMTEEPLAYSRYYALRNQ
jgi:succinate-semialdehyde dehydrogenase/glutarate-semialdehyde dehydrogenase